MQLADQKQSDRDELEPILYAALINSMVQNFWAIFLGSACTAVAAVMTALKTGDVRQSTFPCYKRRVPQNDFGTGAEGPQPQASHDVEER